LLGALRGEGTPKSDIGAIMDVEKIANGEEAWVRSGSSQRMKKVKRVVRKLVPVVEEPSTAFETAPPVSEFIASPLLTETHPDLDIDIDRAFGMSTDETGPHADLNPFDENELIAGPLPNIDPVLFDILKSEVASHLDTIDSYLADLKKSPGLPTTEPLLRAVHTLNGAIAMVDIPVISQVLAPLEGYVKRLRARQQPPDAAGVAVLTETSKLAASVIAELESNNPQMPNSDELATRRPRPRPPEQLVPTR
jgi:chemosensory pili system protein ChpA (sensor histidine kinase/response regulator)